jgi:hypothetical protein
VVTDEISQVEGKAFERMMRLWDVADRVPAFVVLGDKWQMAGFGDRRPWETTVWHYVFKTELVEPYRCKDPAFQKILNTLRTAKPDQKLLKQLQKRKAWTPPGPPTAEGLRKLLHAHPDTTILTCTRIGAQRVNECALEALFPHYPPMVILDGDLETNPDNYFEGQLKAFKECKPSRIPIYKGMKVYLTKNVRKDIDFVNGMSCDVLGFDRRTKGLQVRTATGYIVVVWPWCDRDHGNHVYYPLRPGYASTILKFQGAELKHVTVYLDAEGVPGAAYTALSRVSYGSDFLIGGIVKEEHFIPAR